MAQYKVPQDVEAEDKLLGPFTFRQFIYLIVAAGSAALAYALFQIFPLLGILPIPLFIFFSVLALPLKKDQPMETYLAAIVSFYLKPRKRIWTPGEEESTIEITAPKKTEKPRARNITEEEAGHRLSFLADLVDTEGQSIRNVDTAVRDEYIAEANAIPDIMDIGTSRTNLNQMINREEEDRKKEAIEQLRQAMSRNTNLEQGNINPVHEQTIAPPTKPSTPTLPNLTPTPPINTAEKVMYAAPTPPPSAAPPQPTPAPQGPKLITDSPVVVQPDLSHQNKPSATKKAALKNLAANKDYSIETLAKEAKRLEKQKDNEVYISLH